MRVRSTQKAPTPWRERGPCVKDAAQALGLRPWLAALPLRERRLRARLLMCAPNGVVNDLVNGRDHTHCDILLTWGSDLDFVGGRSDQKADRFSRHGKTRHPASRVVLCGKSTQMDTSCRRC